MWKIETPISVVGSLLIIALALIVIWIAVFETKTERASK
jgi:uncharacterized protein YoxC